MAISKYRAKKNLVSGRADQVSGEDEEDARASWESIKDAPDTIRPPARIWTGISQALRRPQRVPGRVTNCNCFDFEEDDGGRGGGGAERP